MNTIQNLGLWGRISRTKPRGVLWASYSYLEATDGCARFPYSFTGIAPAHQAGVVVLHPATYQKLTGVQPAESLIQVREDLLKLFEGAGTPEAWQGLSREA